LTVEPETRSAAATAARSVVHVVPAQEPAPSAVPVTVYVAAEAGAAQTTNTTNAHAPTRLIGRIIPDRQAVVSAPYGTRTVRRPAISGNAQMRSTSASATGLAVTAIALVSISSMSDGNSAR
jgi:hypothetical protein